MSVDEKVTGTALTWLGVFYAIVDYLSQAGLKLPESRREWLTLIAGCILAAIGYLARGRHDLTSKNIPVQKTEPVWYNPEKTT